MSNKKPYVTVLMTAFNAEKFIAEAIESILNQTFKNFEFIIVDDGSEDSTRDVIDSYDEKDERIKVLYNHSNKGLIYSLNRGLDEAKGEYIARMDADDISLPTRLEVQVSFMDSNKEIGVSSAWMKTLGKSKEVVWQTPVTHEEIIARMFCHNCIWHPTAMIRKDTLDTYNLRYDSNHPKAEDYKLWLEIARYKKLANIPQILHRYRIHDQQKTSLDSKLDKSTKKRLEYRRDLPGIRVKMLKDFLSREISLKEVEIHAKLFFEIPFMEEEELENIQEWVDFLISVNHEKKKYIEPAFSNTLQQTVLNTKKKSFKFFCNQQKHFTPKIISKLFFSRSKYYSRFSLFELMVLTINCLIFRPNKNYSDKFLQAESQID